MNQDLRVALDAGDLGLDFSGECLLASTGREIPSLVEIARLLPAEDNPRGQTLQNVEVAQLVMRITDWRFDACMRKKVKGLARLLEKQSLIVDGHLQRLRTLRNASLYGFLASRGSIVSRGMNFGRLIGIADNYLKACNDKLNENIKRLKLLILQC